MRKQQPTTKTLNATAIRRDWSTVLNSVAVKASRVLVEKSGIPVAAIVSADDLERLLEYEAQRDRDFAVLDEIGKAFADVPPEEIEREVAKALAEVRAENRAKEQQEQPATQPA
jgi:prevent-host-death family protein